MIQRFFYGVAWTNFDRMQITEQNKQVSIGWEAQSGNKFWASFFLSVYVHMDMKWPFREIDDDL